MTENRFDIIVIGAGYGGVTAAAKLTSMGYRVLVVDKNKSAGGKAIRVKKDGTAFELWPIAGGPTNPSRFIELIELLGLDKDTVIQSPQTGANFIYINRDGRQQSLKVPSTPMRNPFTVLNYFSNYDLKPWQIVGLIRIVGQALLTPMSLLDKYDDVSMLDLMDRAKLPDPARALVGMLMNLFYVVPVDQVPVSEVFRTLKDIARGGAGRYHKHGYGDIAEKAVQYITSRGSGYMPGTRVEKILVENNKVAGISTKDGDFKAPVIISNAGIQPTILKLAGKSYFEDTYINRIEALKPSLAFVGVRYHLDAEIFNHPMTVVFSDESWLTKERFSEAEKGNWPDVPIIFVTVPALYDPGLGTKEVPQVALIGTVSSPDPCSPMNETAVSKLEEAVKKIWPDITNHIVERHVADAGMVSAMSRDSVVTGQGGECVGIGQIIGQSGKSKPNPRTPLKGLYIVGCDAGGTGIGTTQAVDSGFNVAEMVMKDIRTEKTP